MDGFDDHGVDGLYICDDHEVDGYGYDDGLYEIHDENMDWTCIPDLVCTCETLFTQG